MKYAVALLCGLFLSACAIHTSQEIASVRASGVSNRTTSKLEHHGILYPEDLIELRRHQVDDHIPIRHLDKVGVDYLVHRADIRSLRNASVHEPVIDELIRASDHFAEDRYERPHAFSWGFAFPYYDPFYWGLGYLGLGYWGHGYSHGDHHDHHDHGGHGDFHGGGHHHH
jgi:hypothetical protein